MPDVEFIDKSGIEYHNERSFELSKILKKIKISFNV